MKLFDVRLDAIREKPPTRVRHLGIEEGSLQKGILQGIQSTKYYLRGLKISQTRLDEDQSSELVTQSSQV